MNEESNDQGYECPKCNHLHECDDWGYNYDNEEYNCEECGYKFYATANHTTTFDSRPSCKLNGLSHKYGEVMTLQGSIGRYLECDGCEHTIFEEHQKDEFKKEQEK